MKVARTDGAGYKVRLVGGDPRAATGLVTRGRDRTDEDDLWGREGEGERVGMGDLLSEGFEEGGEGWM